MFETYDAARERLFRNWAENHVCAPKSRIEPSSEREVVDLVERVRRDGETIRVVGAGHSWSDVACTGGHLVSLDRMNDVVDIDRERGTATVDAGLRLKHLVPYLLERGLALPNLGSILEQSVAGVISTGTHGTGIGLGNLSSTVRSMRLVDGRGRIVELGEDDGRLDAARVSIGALGVITRVTLDVVPAFNLHEQVWTLSFREALDQMHPIVERHDHVKFWWLPHTDQVQVFAADRTDEEKRPAGVAQRLDESGLLTPLFSGVIGLGNRVPEAIPALNNLVAEVYFDEFDHVAESHRVFNLPMPPPHLESEYGFPAERADEGLRRLRNFIDDEGLGVNFITEVRFVAPDDIWLSPAYERASAQIGAYIGETPRWRDYFEGFEEIALEMDGRPHWGKTFYAGPDDLRRNLPRFDDFLELRRELDPDGVFLNDFTRRVFGVR